MFKISKEKKENFLAKNYETLLREIKVLKNQRDMPCLWITKCRCQAGTWCWCQNSPNWSVDSMQSQLKPQMIINYIWKYKWPGIVQIIL